MSVFEIPLQPQAQRFTIILEGNVQYAMVVTWNKYSSSWILSIYDNNDVALIEGAPLVTGADLLEQFEYLGIGGQLIVQSDGVTDAVPTFENLGSVGHLYYRVAQ